MTKRIFTLGEISLPNNIKQKKEINDIDATSPKTKEEIQSYVNKMNDNEKKEYLFFLTHKISQEKEAVKKGLEEFHESLKDYPIIGEVSNFDQLIYIYDEVIIPMVRGVYKCDNMIEEQEMKQLKKKIMGKLTLAYFDEYINSKK
jgi:hypothetical protein